MQTKSIWTLDSCHSLFGSLVFVVFAGNFNCCHCLVIGAQNKILTENSLNWCFFSADFFFCISVALSVIAHVEMNKLKLKSVGLVTIWYLNWSSRWTSQRVLPRRASSIAIKQRQSTDAMKIIREKNRIRWLAIIKCEWCKSELIN